MPPSSPVVAARSLPRHHGIIKPVAAEALMAIDARIAERSVLVATEGEDCLIHLLGVEHLQLHEQMEVLYRQAGDSQKQFRLKLGDNILQRILAEIGQIHKGRNARGKLD